MLCYHIQGINALIVNQECEHMRIAKVTMAET
jgi:hypothetical protein